MSPVVYCLDFSRWRSWHPILDHDLESVYGEEKMTVGETLIRRHGFTFYKADGISSRALKTQSVFSLWGAFAGIGKMVSRSYQE